MNDALLTAIWRFSVGFRSRDPAEFEFELFSMFPNSCCEYASLLLAKFLFVDFSVKDIRVVYGEHGSGFGVGHVWLRICELNVDITASQFDDGLPDVLLTRPGEWHDRYEIVRSEMFCPDFYDGYCSEGREQIVADYEFLSGFARGAG
jgi:hypothetical protein